MDTSTRLPGHGLLSEGKPYERGSGRWKRIRVSIGSSIGVALCSCGTKSPVLGSDAARKRWHRDVHKPEVRAQQRASEGNDHA